MGVDLGSAAVGVIEHHSDGVDSAALFDQMRSKRVAQGVRRNTFGQTGIASGDLDRALHGGGLRGREASFSLGKSSALG